MISREGRDFMLPLIVIREAIYYTSFCNNCIASCTIWLKSIGFIKTSFEPSHIRSITDRIGDLNTMNPYTTYSSSPINKAKPMSNALPSYTSKNSQATDMTSNPLKSSSKPTPRKKRPAPSNVDNEDEEASAAAQFALGGITTKSPRKKKAKNEESEEKRLRRFRARPPVSFTERLQRARTQRMFLIERTRQVSDDGMHAEEVLDIAGTTGNVYQVTVSKVPSCSCPDAAKGNQCKHIVYVWIYCRMQLYVLNITGNGQHSQSPRTSKLSTRSSQHRTQPNILCRSNNSTIATTFSVSYTPGRLHRHWRRSQNYRRRLSSLRHAL